MALILSLKEGEDFYVAEERVMVRKILPNLHFILDLDGDAYEIVEDRMTEILPEVFISSGDRGNPATARVVIEAPREVLVLRGKSYRRGLQGGNRAQPENVQTDP